MKEVIDYYKTLANYLFAVGGGLASIVIALSAYFWTANPPLPLDNRFLAVAVVLVVASLFFCGDVIWLSFIIKKIRQLSFIRQTEEERAKQEQVSSAGKSPSSNSNDTSTLGLIISNSQKVIRKKARS